MHSEGSIGKAKDLSAVPHDWSFQHDCHVIDWWLHHSLKHPSVQRWLSRIIPLPDRFDPEDWTRFDGELL